MPYTPIRFSFPAADVASSDLLTDTQLLDYIGDALFVMEGVHRHQPSHRQVQLTLGALGTGEGTTFRAALHDIYSKTVLNVVTAKLSG
jgi:hypothetical protein